MNASTRQLDPSIGFALLAAGESRRFGGGKLDAPLGTKPLWRWAADTVVAAGFVTRLLIVSEKTVPAQSLTANDWQTATNPNAQAGLATSIALACALAKDCSRLVIGLADMPFVEPDHLRALAQADGVVFTLYPSGRAGVPAGFPGDAFSTLAGLRGDRGAAGLNWGKPLNAIAPASLASLLDIDTPDDLERARGQLLARG